ncbi:MAG: TraB/GumN family protein, partial [Sphingobacteriales bacterium]
ANYYTDYFREATFTGGDFVNQLQGALRFEPELNDALLYRTESRMDNFQEDTYLDLYIYQTGKKLGKQTAGVETFMGSQRMMVEALVDAAAEKDKKQNRSRVAQSYELGQTLQDAYRRGDLDMLDSINKITEYAESFTEKFLYKRNEMQASSMDSIMEAGKSLFVGVGAAHLPGKRGVIEILRKKGYTLRPIYMQDRDATQKKYIDSLTAPVHFVQQYSADSFIKVSVPGKLNDLGNSNISLKHYADMGNGSYYMLTRIRTNTLFNGFDQKKVLKFTDSLLYENIPGSIISRRSISQNGYDGVEVINRTKKGEVQHYQLYVTPTEVLIFKMGGKGNYVNGKEAETFFSSINFKEKETKTDWKPFVPASGGFTVNMPVVPQTSFVASASDGLPEWRYESVDPATGDHYAVFRKSMYSFDFIEADTFDQLLMIESLGSNEGWKKSGGATISLLNGRPVRNATFKTDDGEYVYAMAVLLGPQYYLLVHRSASKMPESSAGFFKSFNFSGFKYANAEEFSDTLLKFKVLTPVKPSFDADMMDMMMYAKKNEQVLKKDITYNDMPEDNTANFISEETGEVIVVNTFKYPDYYFAKDSAKFWQYLFNPDSSLVLRKKVRLDKGNDTRAWLLEWKDTASTRIIKKLITQKGLSLLTASTNIDSLLPASSFVRDFYN